MTTTPPKRRKGRPPTPAPLRGRIFAAVPPSSERAAGALAARYGVTVAQLVRWWTAEIEAGTWFPVPFRATDGAEKKEG